MDGWIIIIIIIFITHSNKPRIPAGQDASLVRLCHLVIIRNMWLSFTRMILFIPRIGSIFKMQNKLLLVTKSEIPTQVLMMQDEETHDRNVQLTQASYISTILMYTYLIISIFCY